MQLTLRVSGLRAYRGHYLGLRAPSLQDACKCFKHRFEGLQFAHRDSVPSCTALLISSNSWPQRGVSHGEAKEAGTPSVGCNDKFDFGLALLGGSWAVISGVISPLIRVISIITLIITLLITTHEPPSKGDVVM